jgi:hexosaminidase
MPWVVCFLVVLPCAAAHDAPQPPHLLPWPKSIVVAPGRVRIDAESRIVAADAELKPLAAILRDELRLVSGLRLALAEGPARDGDISLAINRNLEAGGEILAVRRGELVRTRDGAHRIATQQVIRVEGAGYRAVAEGTVTLLQAVSRSGDSVTVPAMTVHDWPHADYTGVMLDVARQAHTLEDIRHCILVCRAYKVRYLQLHMTDDQAWTIPSTAYPRLGTMNGSAHGGPVPPRYDLAALKELVAFADARGVTLVPELETPGHSSNACSTLPEVFGYLHPNTSTALAQGMMNLANPRLYEALDVIVGEMCDVFTSSPYVHIGCDEVSGLANVADTPQAEAFMREKNLNGAGDLLAFFVSALNDMVKRRGRKAILWEGAANGAARDIVHMTWDGNARTAERLVAAGITTITVPWNLAGVPWQDWTMYHSNGSMLRPGDPVLGAMLPLWEQQGPVHLRWLRAAVGKRQERTWGPETRVTAPTFEARLAAADRFVARLLYGFAIWHDPECEEGLTHRQVGVPTMLSLQAWPTSGTIRFTTDGTTPNADSPAFTSPLAVADSFTLTARLFDAAGAPDGPPWSQPYIFAPLALRPDGLLAGGDWFSAAATVAIESRVDAGAVRYTLDGSPPLPTSTPYTRPLALAATTTIRARWFDADNVPRGDAVGATYHKLATVDHTAVGRPITVIAPERLPVPDQAATLLVDGVLARTGAWGTPEVLALGSGDLEAVIDLGAGTPIHTVAIRCIHCQEAGIYPARGVSVLVSADGKTFTPAGETGCTVPDARGADGVSVREIVVRAEGAGRFVKIVCRNNGQLPAWHNAPGVTGHLMLDEIIVNAPRDDR